MKVKVLQIVWHNKEPVFSLDFDHNGTLVTAGADSEIKVGIRSAKCTISANRDWQLVHGLYDLTVNFKMPKSNQHEDMIHTYLRTETFLTGKRYHAPVGNQTVDGSNSSSNAMHAAMETHRGTRWRY